MRNLPEGQANDLSLWRHSSVSKTHFREYLFRRGRMAEWSKALVLGTSLRAWVPRIIAPKKITIGGNGLEIPTAFK